MKKQSWAKRIAKDNLMYASALLLFLFIMAALIGLYISHTFSTRDSIMICTGIFIGASFYYMMEKVLKKKFLPQWGRYKTFKQGVAGEVAVHNALAKNIGKGNLIISDVLLEEHRGNIDHVVIGQNGIFVIETKTNLGRIVCDGDYWFQDKNIGEKIIQINLKYSPSKQAKSNAVHLKSFLNQYYPKLANIWIKAIVIFPNKQSEGIHVEIKNEPQDCKVFDSIGDMIGEMKKETISMKLTTDDLIRLENIFLSRSVETVITN